MKELPRVSVAIITYQHENYVQECLESIVNQQGLFELEIMIFDDHSQDGTLEQVRLFSATDTAACTLVGGTVSQ